MNIENIYKILKITLKKYKIPLTEQKNIKTKESFFVLIGVILSARTKDIVTANVCDNLFKEISNINDLKKIKITKLEKLLYPVGFYKTKAKNIKQLSLTLEKQFNNKVPSTLEELLMLPGVGRKTANLVLSMSFNKPAICVDTHVHRIMNRIGFIDTKNPLQTELILRTKLQKNYGVTQIIYL